MDAFGMAACITAGAFGADEVVAVIGKTEGNGGVNDFTRILADQAFRGVLKKLGNRSEADIAEFPWCGRAVATASSRRMQRNLPATLRPARPSRPAWQLALP